MKRMSLFSVVLCVLAATHPSIAQDILLTDLEETAEDSRQIEGVACSFGDGGEVSHCDACSCQPCCCPSGAWFAGVEATFLNVNPTNNRVAFDDTNLFGDPQFDYGFEGSPRLWVGRQFDNCWGVRGRYWQFDAEARESIGPAGAQNELGRFNSNIQAYTVDVELTRQLWYGCQDMLASFGARHASIEHAYIGDIVDLGGALDLDSLTLARRVEGTGITAAIEGRRPIGCSSLSFFWSARGSVLWGDSKANGVLIEVSGGEVFPGTSTDNGEMIIGEAQLGLQWSRAIECLGGVEVFLRSAFEYQVWDLSTSQLVLVGADEDAPRVDALGRGDVHFYGVAFAAGILR